MSNRILKKAQKIKDDEFYTKYEDIEKELKHYKDYLKNKVIYCPCDSINSNFVKYLKDNQKEIGYKKVVYTSYQDGFDFREQDNSFADVIITNPPFSLFAEFMDWVDNKDCIILGPFTALSYPKIFNNIKNKKLKLGISFHKNFTFDRPDGSEKIVGCGWYTTFPVRKIEPLDLKTKAENEANGVVYEKYDNYNAINVDKAKNIPSDYKEPFGVPITFIEKWNPDEYDILVYKLGNDNKQLRVNGKDKFMRLIIRRK